MRSIIVFVVFIVFLSGCASTQTSYTPPTNTQVQTEKVLPLAFDEAWDKYVAELSKSFFVINNISKESRIINVSFSTNDPGEFIDCGATTRKTVHPAIGEKVFYYRVADDSTYLYGVKGTNVLWRVNRVTNLKGRANIYMAPQGGGTLIRANAKYVWTVDIAASANVGGSSKDSLTLDFSSQEAASRPQVDSEGNQSTLVCGSSGILERRLLDLIRN